jgi:hypothetical protein
MTYPFTEWSCPTEASVILGGIAFRLMIELASKFIEVKFISKKDMKFSNHSNRPLYKIVQKVFLVDLQRDIKFYVSICLNLDSNSITEKPTCFKNFIKSATC